MSTIEFFSNGVLFVLCDAAFAVAWAESGPIHEGNVRTFLEPLEGTKGLVWTTILPGTYRVQLTRDEVAIPSEMHVHEDVNVFFPTGQLVMMPNSDGIEVFTSIGTIPPGHYRATVHWSSAEDAKHISRSEYPEGDGPDGIIVLRPLRRRVWLGHVIELVAHGSRFAIVDETNVDASLSDTWTLPVPGTYLIYLGLEDSVLPTAAMHELDRRHVRFKTGRLKGSPGAQIGTIPPGHYEAIFYGSHTAPSADPERSEPDGVIVLRPCIPVDQRDS